VRTCRRLAHEAGRVLLHDPADFTPLPGSAGIPRSATGPAAATGPATTAQCRGVREVEAESVAYLVAAAHGLPTDDYTFAYVTGWAAGVDRAEPEKVVRDTGARVLAAGRAVLAGTQPEATATAAGRGLAAGAQAGTERTAAARAHAAATLVLAQPAAVDPAAAAVELAALARTPPARPRCSPPAPSRNSLTLRAPFSLIRVTGCRRQRGAGRAFGLTTRCGRRWPRW
jgi:hypothetical protein